MGCEGCHDTSQVLPWGCVLHALLLEPGLLTCRPRGVLEVMLCVPEPCSCLPYCCWQSFNPSPVGKPKPAFGVMRDTWPSHPRQARGPSAASGLDACVTLGKTSRGTTHPSPRQSKLTHACRLKP